MVATEELEGRLEKIEATVAALSRDATDSGNEPV